MEDNKKRRMKRMLSEDTELTPVKNHVQPEVASVSAEFEKAKMRQKVQQAQSSGMNIQSGSTGGKKPKSVNRTVAATGFAKDIGSAAGYGSSEETDTGSGATGGALSGAATGAALGSIVPGVGTAVGAVVGGVIGGVAGGLGAKANYDEAVAKGKARAKAQYHSSMREIETSRESKVQNALSSLKSAFGNNSKVKKVKL